ncbi:flagellar filament capping protein FliD [Effusibacillus consociatus]|uniref:Flagellar hook-associated protein 2 n=1 Tax=Effusibacillus consociatus TaxID=1117041 RepID=A0ABV9Q3B2_9BACL
MSISGMGGLGGLVSGMDTKSLIEKLMMLEAQPLVKMKQQQKLVELRKGLYNEVNSSLLSLKTKAEALSKATSVLAKKMTSSDDKTVTATTADATKVVSGTYNIEITKLATALTGKSTASLSSATTGLNYSGTFNIVYKDGVGNTQTSKDITIDPSDSLTTIATKINSALDNTTTANPMKVKATVVDKTLILASTETGAGRSIQITGSASQSIFGSTASGGLGLIDAGGNLIATDVGQDADFKVNGVQVIRKFNSNLTDVIMGVNLNLLKDAGSSGIPAKATLTVEADLDSSVKLVRDFVDQYNATMDLIQTRLKEHKVPDAKSDALMSKGLLRGDSALISIQSSLRSIMGATFSGSQVYSTLHSIGIEVDTSTDKGKSGRLMVNDKKLRDALTNNPNEVMKVLYVDINSNGRLDENDSTNAAGMVGMLNSKLFMLTDSTTALFGSTSAPKGLLPSRIKLMDKEIDSFNDRMEVFNRRLEMKRNQLEAQFTNLETMMQQTNAAGGFLMQRMG